ncbi:hypothetical protein [Streptomyces cyaneofuscatus]
MLRQAFLGVSTPRAVSEGSPRIRLQEPGAAPGSENRVLGEGSS